MKINNQYENLLRDVLENGIDKADRTGVGTRSVFGRQMRFNLAEEGFPLITTKKVHLRSIIHELLWIISGDTNIKYLQDNQVTIWDEWADADGDLGPVYGHQWRDFGGHESWDCFDDCPVYRDGVDQLLQVIESIRTNPDSRRHIISAWNPIDVPDMALPPCHAFMQFNVRDGFLDLQLYQRSADMFLGVPFNIASYALLLMMVAQQTDLTPGEFIWTGGDIHIYHNHFEQVKQQLGRRLYAFPQMNIRPAYNIDEYGYADFELVNYRHHPAIKAPVAV